MQTKSRRRLTLRTKWTVALLLCGAAPLCLLSAVSVIIQRAYLETAERQVQVALIGQVAGLLERTLDEAAEATHRAGAVLTEARVTDDEARLALCRDTIARAGSLAEVAIYGADGSLIDAIRRTGDVPAAGPAPPEHVPPEWLGRDGGWLPPEFRDGSVVLRYLEPVLQHGQRRAFVLGRLLPGALQAGLQDLGRDYLDRTPDAILVLDGNLRVLVSSEGDAAAGASLAGRDMFRNVSAGALARSLALATEFRDEHGRAMLGTLHTLPGRGLVLAVRRPRALAYQALYAARLTLAGSAAVLAVLALGAGAFLAARTTRPVRRLMELAAAYGRREFSATAEVRTGDELEDLGGALTGMARSLAASEQEIARRAGVEASLSRYLPGEVARAIAAGQGTLALGGERRMISVLFADLTSFTAFTESAPPERVVAFLNELYAVLTEVVFRHGGTVDKFMGDCIMALFGAPEAQADHAARALLCAEDMHRFAEASAAAWKRDYGVETRLAIGISSGEAIVGNLGSERRMEYTAIGDVVNTAARLEAMARPGQTLCTAEVARLSGGEFALAEIGEYPLRGKTRSVQILELR